MSKVVIYQSSTGFTKQYAQWIAEELNCRAINIKEMTDQDVSEKDMVIYGGWIMGSTIVGYDKIKEKGMKKLVVFAVGASLDTQETRETIISVNHLEEVPFFYLPGGMRFQQLNFFVRFILKQIKKSIAKKEEKSKQDKHMEQVLGTDFDISDKKYIEKLTEYVKEQE